MSESVTQWEIYHEARNHLRLIEPLLKRIGCGSASQESVGYVEMDTETDERLTDMGWSTVEALRTVALDSADHLWNVAGETTGSRDTRLLYDVQGFFAVLVCALRGMDKDAPQSVNPPWVATHLWTMLRALQERVGEEQEPEITDTISRVEEPEPTDGPGAYFEIRKALRPVKLLSEQFVPIVFDGGELSHHLQEVAEDLSFLAGKALERLEAIEPPVVDEIQDTYLSTLSTLAALHLLGRHLSVTGCDEKRIHEFEGDFNIPEQWYLEALIHLATDAYGRIKDSDMSGRWESLCQEKEGASHA